MGVRPFTRILAGLVSVAAATPSVSSYAATVGSGESALSLKGGGALPAAAAVAPVRAVKLTRIRTTDYTVGTVQVTGTLTPAPPAGSRVAFQRWSTPNNRWEEVGNGKSAGVNVTIAAKLPGSIRMYRLAIAPRSPYAAAASAPSAFAQYVWRGIFKQPVLATGGKNHPQFNVVPPADAPRRAEAELLADKGGQVWGDINTTGCAWARTWLGNITDGTVRTSLLNDAKVLGTVTQAQETETWLNRRLLGSTRTRLQVVDVKSGYGPQVAVDATLLCSN